MKKKFLSVILCLSMVLSMAACGSEPAEQESVASGAAVAESETTESVVDAEPVTLVVEVYDRGNMNEAYGTCTDNKWVELFQEAVLEELNIDLQYMAIPRSGDTTQLQTLMAAGNEPDIFFTYSADQFVKWANEEVLADLTPYMDSEAGQKLKADLGQDVLSYGVVNGKRFAINGVRDNLGNYASFIRKDMLDAVGVELDELNGHYAITPSKLEEALLKIKDAGLCDYPFALMNAPQKYCQIEGAFLVDESVDSEDAQKNANSVFFNIDGDKEAFRFLNKCYNEGLINPDFALYKDENIKEMVSSGQAAFWGCNYWNYATEAAALYSAEPEAEIVAVEVTQEDGTPARYTCNTPVAAYGMISSECENIEAALSLIHWFLTSETAHLLSWHGIEGEHYEVDADGDYVAIDAEYNTTDRISVNDLNILSNSDKCSGYGTDDFERVYRKQNEGLTDERIIQASIDGYYIATSEGKFPTPTVNATIDALSEYAAELTENKDNLVVGSIMAPVDQFDEVYDAYLKIYMEEGGSQVAEQRMEAIK